MQRFATLVYRISFRVPGPYHIKVLSTVPDLARIINILVSGSVLRTRFATSKPLGGGIEMSRQGNWAGSRFSADQFPFIVTLVDAYGALARNQGRRQPEYGVRQMVDGTKVEDYSLMTPISNPCYAMQCDTPAIKVSFRSFISTSTADEVKNGLGDVGQSCWRPFSGDQYHSEIRASSNLFAVLTAHSASRLRDLRSDGLRTSFRSHARIAKPEMRLSGRLDEVMLWGHAK